MGCRRESCLPEAQGSALCRQRSCPLRSISPCWDFLRCLGCGFSSCLFSSVPRPLLSNASKTLTSMQRQYSQIQKEALAIIFALNKFHQFLYGCSFILVTDHKSLIELFGPTKATPALAANRLARWALTLSQYQYTIEYRKTCDHSNADALSRLPVGPDASFNEEEDEADVDTVCTIKTVSLQLVWEQWPRSRPRIQSLPM